ncbi:MAG: four helix bundle protein, partial [Bacteroidaceae bacterium]|nr:four helix bundle protein [Bacteroidaceae bacterium]
MDGDFSFRNLLVYQQAKDLVVHVYQLVKQFPKEEHYALCDQLRRAVISIPSNIAEGMGRTSKKEQLHFMEIAYGS